PRPPVRLRGTPRPQLEPRQTQERLDVRRVPFGALLVDVDGVGEEPACGFGVPLRGGEQAAFRLQPGDEAVARWEGRADRGRRLAQRLPRARKVSEAEAGPGQPEARRADGGNVLVLARLRPRAFVDRARLPVAGEPVQEPPVVRPEGGGDGL